MSCNITYDEQGNIVSVLQDNGKPSNLYKEALELTQDQESAKTIYLVSKTPMFKEEVEEPQIRKYQYNILQKLKTLKPSIKEIQIGEKIIKIEDIKYKLKKVNGYQTIQQIAGEKVIGRIRLKDNAENLKIDSVLVDKDLQGIGLGTELYKQAIRYAFRENKSLQSDDNQSADAIRVWEKLQQVGVVDKNIKFQILGEQGARNLDKAQEATFRLDNLAVAKEMEAQGKTSLQIKALTGWEQNPVDKLWRYEIPDGKIKNVDFAPQTFDNKIQSMVNNLKLSDIYEDNQLYVAYPNLKNMDVVLYTPANELYESAEAFLLDDKIYINKNRYDTRGNSENNDNSFARTTLSHEVSHAIQKAEGAGRGSSPEFFKGRVTRVIDAIIRGDSRDNYEALNGREFNRIIERIIKKTKPTEKNREGLINQISLALYNNTSGEVEARSITNRINYTDEQRRNSLLSEELGISPEDQIFIQDGLQSNKQEQNVEEIINQLKKTGLADNVYMLSNKEIEDKLVELEEKNVEKITAGFTYKNDIYLNKDGLNLTNASIHEFGHLHLNWLKQNKNNLYQAGLSLVDKNKKEAIPYIEYVKTTQPNLKEGTEEFNNEVLAQVIGDNGEKLIGKKSGLKQWLLDFWQELKTALGLTQYTAEQVSNMTLEEFGKATAVDLLKGETININSKPFEEPKAGIVINFIETKNYEEPLNKEQIDEVKATLLGNNLKSSNELIKKLETAKVTNPTLQSLKTFYTHSEAVKILENPNKIKEFYYRLKQTEPFEIIEEANPMFIATSTFDKDIVGKTRVDNPLIKQAKFREEFGGIKDETGFNQKLSNSEFSFLQQDAKQLFEQYSKLNRITVKDINFEDVPKNNTKPFLEVTLKADENFTLRRAIDRILNIPTELWTEKETAILLKDVKNRAIENSLDLKDFELKTEKDIKTLLSSLRTALNTSEVGDFAKVYDDIFAVDKSVREAVIEDNRNIVKIQGKDNDYNLFSKFGILPLGNNLYLKTDALNRTLEEAKDIVGLSDSELSKATKNIYLAGAENVDVETLQKMALYATHFKTKFEDVTPEKIVEGEEFSDLYRDNLRKPNENNIFTETGLEHYIEQKTEEKQPQTFQEQREAILKNPQSLTLFKGNYFNISENEIQADSTQDFIRTQRGVFELTQNNVYTRLTDREPGYENNYAPYINQNTEIKQNNLFSKKEGENILKCE